MTVARNSPLRSRRRDFPFRLLWSPDFAGQASSICQPASGRGISTDFGNGLPKVGARASLAGGNLSPGRRTPLPRHAVRQMDTRAAHRAVGVALLSGQAAVSFYISMTIAMPIPPQTAFSRDVEVSQTPRLHRGQGHKPFIARVSCREWPVLPSRGMMQGDIVAIDISQLQAQGRRAVNGQVHQEDATKQPAGGDPCGNCYLRGGIQNHGQTTPGNPVR